MGVEFREFVRNYDIQHNLVKEKRVNIFLKQKPFVYPLSEKPDEEPIDYSNDAPTMINKEEKEDIKNAGQNKQTRQDKEQETIDYLKEDMEFNKKNKKQLIV